MVIAKDPLRRRQQLERNTDMEAYSSRWPSQDMVDRSEDFSIIAVLIGRPEEVQHEAGLSMAARQESYALADAFREALDQSVAESIQEVLEHGSGVRPSPAQHYQIGPAAEGPPTLIVELWNRTQDLRPILSDMADAYAVTEITRRTVAKLAEWSRRVGARFAFPSFIFTPYRLSKLCEEHVRRTYHPRARLSVGWTTTTTEFYGGYRSPAHPTGGVDYVVTVSAGRKIYSYATDGGGRVTSHYVREGRRITSLPIPSLLGSSEE
jgi:hypothetical protein